MEVANIIHGDILIRTLSFLTIHETIQCRAVATCWKEAVSETPVQEEYHVKSKEVLRRLSVCLPKLQSIRIDSTTIPELNDDIAFRHTVSLFQHLERLSCLYMSNLKHSFQEIRHLRNLVSLNLHDNEALEWKLRDVADHLPRLQRLFCVNNRCVRGDLRDLLQHHSLKVLALSGCSMITGDLMDLATHMPDLEIMFLDRTKVMGDIRRLGPQHFGRLKWCGLSQGIYGSHQLRRVDHAAAVMRGRHYLARNHNIGDDSPIFPIQVVLSPDSPDYHERVEQRLYSSERDPPFQIETVVAGRRKGWRWSNYLGGHCNIHWLDSEPDPSEPDYDEYEVELAALQSEANPFSGFWNPPTQGEYDALRRGMLL